MSPIIFASDITSTHQFINYQIMIHRCEKLLVLLMASYLLLVKICWVNLISVDIEFVKQNSNEFVVSAMLPHLMRIYLFQWKSPKKNPNIEFGTFFLRLTPKISTLIAIIIISFGMCTDLVISRLLIFFCTLRKFF